MDAIRRYDATIEPVLITMKTQGDLMLDRKLDEVGGKGLFVKELDDALMRGECDICVHSLKDMPCDSGPLTGTAELPIVAMSKREDPRDVLVMPLDAKTESAVAHAKPVKLPIGCSSARRTTQLQKLFPAAVFEAVRGNIPTRLRKLDEGKFGALVLAAAGLKRLGLEHRISRTFEPWELLPAAGQGIIAVQAGAGADTSYLKLFHDPESAMCAGAERAFIAELGADCFSPVAAFATLNGGSLCLRVMVADDNDIPRYDEIAVKLTTEIAANRLNITEAAKELARRFK
jgi:hydroxymethylbilane synthase